MATIHDIPYERQANRWSCGAAALAMVYRSFGIECGQEQIWETIRGKSGRGRFCARAQALAADAIQHGLHALVIQVRDPWVVLERCIRQSVRVIINHVPEPKSGGGHYSVLTVLSDDHVVMHDPNFGPNRTLTRNEFLQLWNPRSALAEIISQVMIAIAASPSDLDLCPLCDGRATDAATCRSCNRSFLFQPLSILGCLTDWCPMRAWEQFFCPWCDHHWNSRSGKAKPQWPQFAIG